MQGFLELLRDFMAGPSISVPLPQIVLFVILTSLAAMFERHRLVLILCYGFLLNWVFLQNMQVYERDVMSMASLSLIGILGLLALFLTCYQMLSHSS